MNQRTQFGIMSSEMKLAVLAWISIDQFLLNYHKLMRTANFLYINWFGTYFLCTNSPICAIPTMPFQKALLSLNGCDMTHL